MPYTYKQIFQDYQNITDPLQPLPVSLYERLVSNGQFLVRNRLSKIINSWTGGTTDSTGPNIEGTDIKGYWNTGLYYNNAGTATADYDTQTRGLQFSTHPAEPYILTIPIHAPYSSNLNLLETLKVRIVAEIENADVEVIAFISAGARDSSGAPGDDPDSIKFAGVQDPAASPSGLINFNSSADRIGLKGDGYLEFPWDSLSAVHQILTPTATTGYNGLSYYELTVPNIFAGNPDAEFRTGAVNLVGQYESQNFKPYLVLMFLSKVGSLIDSDTLDTSSPFPDSQIQLNSVGSGAYVLLDTKYNSKFGGVTPPGKYHAVLKTNYTGTSTAYMYHHILQILPVDKLKARLSEDLFVPVDNPWANKHHTCFCIYPSIPYVNILDGSIGAGDAVQVYSLGKISLHSVTIEPTLEFEI